MHYTESEIKDLNRVKRLRLMNSITGIKSANLIGTISEKGCTNLAIFSSVVHLGSNPALIGFVMRPNKDVKRDTLNNILETKQFTINHVHSTFIEKAHYTSLSFNHDQSEFDYCNLESFYIDNYLPPFVKESKVKLGLKLNEIIPIKSNGCKFIIGEVEHILIDDSIDFMTEGALNLEISSSVGVGGLNSYYTMNKIIELPFPRLSTDPPSGMSDFWKSNFDIFKL
jgi:flavin reductase (DIM6/NTAB) family NADH-FMN oxidoreductase RutF